MGAARHTKELALAFFVVEVKAAERAMTAYPFAGLAAGLIRRGFELPNRGYVRLVSEGIGFQKGILRFAIRFG
jgi:hypothetical protein